MLNIFPLIKYRFVFWKAFPFSPPVFFSFSFTIAAEDVSLLTLYSEHCSILSVSNVRNLHGIPFHLCPSYWYRIRIAFYVIYINLFECLSLWLKCTVFNDTVLSFCEIVTLNFSSWLRRGMFSPTFCYGFPCHLVTYELGMGLSYVWR